MNSRKMGFWALTSLVAGSQIGTGIFLLPMTLIQYGIWGFSSWIVSGTGAILLALVFARLVSHIPKTGGPHAFIEAAFGRKAGFFAAWTYWNISWISSSLVVVAIVSYLNPLLGNLHPFVNLIIEIVILLGITGLNLLGARSAGRVEFVLTLLKLLPLLVVPIGGLWFFNASHFAIPSTGGAFQSISAAALLTFWGFIGVEAATAPAESIDNPQKNIPRALIIGTIIVVFVYVLASTGVAAVVPPDVLSQSQAPFADAAQRIFGGNWHLVISIAASIVCVGTLNAWILTSGQIALGGALDNHLPRIFAKKNSKDVPIWAIIISSIGIVPVLILATKQSLLNTINFTIDISVTAFLFVYTASVLSYLKLFWRGSFITRLIGFSALVFCGWLLVSSGIKMIALAALIPLSGLPLYLLRKAKQPVVI